MPNWCRTTIHARNSKQYQELIAELKNHNANADPSFNNVIPMPSELRLNPGSSNDFIVRIYVNALAVKLIRFTRQHDKANANEIVNHLKAYKTGVANMQDTHNFNKRLHAIDNTLKFSDISYPLAIHDLKDTLNHQCQDFVIDQLQADDNRSKLKELITNTIILPKNASDNPYELATQCNLTTDDKWLDPDLKDIPYLTVLYHLGKKYFDNVVKYPFAHLLLNTSQDLVLKN